MRLLVNGRRPGDAAYPGLAALTPGVRCERTVPSQKDRSRRWVKPQVRLTVTGRRARPANSASSADSVR